MIISLIDNYDMVVEEAAKQILFHTPLLYIGSTKKKGSIEPFGSSVLYKEPQGHFLFTAAHCIKQDGELIKIGFLDKDGKLFLIKGAVFMSHGKIDVAAIELSIDTVQALEGAKYSFITADRIYHNSNINVVRDYLIVGFPITKTSVNFKKRRIGTEPLVYTSKSSTVRYYNLLGFQQERSLLLHYNRRKGAYVKEDQMIMNPQPKGISGCGVWYIPSYFVEKVENIDYKLVSIIIEYYQEHNTLVSTKVERLIHLTEAFNFFLNNYRHD